EKITTIRLLLHHGVNIDAINAAFVDAAGSGKLELLRLLLSRGGDVNKVGAQALGYAAGSMVSNRQKQLRATVDFCLSLEAEVNTRDDEGWTPLLNSANRGYASIARVLIEHGADINAKCICPAYLNGGWTALMMATRANHSEVAETLLSKG